MNSDIRRNPEDVKAVAQQLGQYLAEQLERCTRSCLTCDRFDEANEICNKYGGRPPARIIAFGCNGHEDKVPF